jgi:O-antigen biosynthesis protein
LAINVNPNNDIESLSEPDCSLPAWEVTGDDPAFKLKFEIFRPRFLVVQFHALGDDLLDPCIYVNRGSGFKERDAVFLKSGRHFALTADLGSFGTVRALRIDPCSRYAKLSFEARAFHTRREADAYLSTVQSDYADIENVNLGPLPRFWFKVPAIFKSKHTAITRYSSTTYQLAKTTAPVATLSAQPWLSIVVPVYNAPPRYLEDILSSFKTQDQAGAELILSDDCSTSPETRAWLEAHRATEHVKVVFNAVNGGIAKATNSGLEQATGEWVTFLDHDDVVAPHALKTIRHALEEHPSAQFLYTDELIVDDELKPVGVMLKPAFDPVLLSGVNYINHFSLYRRDRLKALGCLRTGYDGSQDYDLLLRYLEGQPEETILHLPYPAYWWRRTEMTYSIMFIQKATDNARTSLTEYFARQGVLARIEPAISPTLHRPEFLTSDHDWPKISIIIPSKDGHDLIKRVLGDIFDKTDYPNYEVIVVDNGSTDQKVLDLYQDLAKRHPNFTADVVVEPFNFSRSINRGFRQATGDHYLLLNNDVEVIDAGWIKEMVSCLRYSNTGIVGAKLIFGNGTIQHAGVAVGFGGLAGHLFMNKPARFGGPMNRLHVRNSLTCVTGAVMLISGDCHRTLGDWDEDRFAIAYNDVDYCMRAHKAGFRIVWTPFATLYHHESLSRGAEEGKEKTERFDREKAHLRERHQTLSFEDPALNPNYSRDQSTPIVVVPTKLHAARHRDMTRQA